MSHVIEIEENYTIFTQCVACIHYMLWRTDEAQWGHTKLIYGIPEKLILVNGFVQDRRFSDVSFIRQIEVENGLFSIQLAITNPSYIISENYFGM